MLKFLKTNDIDFKKQLSNLIAIESVIDVNIAKIVDDIILKVRQGGDSEIVKFSNKFDNNNAKTMADLTISKDKLKTAFDSISDIEKNALVISANRIKQYHKKQLQKSWDYKEKDGTVLGQKITSLDKVGIYVPGGKASYPSSVLMNAIPAKIAGVNKIIMVVPAPDNIISKLVLAAAYIVKADELYTIGGAQSIAALAYGTKTITKVDKIVGPGNAYVASAKKAVFGVVGIDMIAGPSEILIICDGNTNPDWIAMDLFSQAEHDENAQAILLCHCNEFIKKVRNSIKKLLPNMLRAKIISKSLSSRGAIIKTNSIAQSIEIANFIAPEHLELSVDNAKQYLKDIKNAGAIFVGKYSSEALGDYCAGPNHVLPTSGSARFSSPLGVYDFQKHSNVIMVSKQGANDLGKIATVLADGEHLQAHKLSAKYRINN